MMWNNNGMGSWGYTFMGLTTLALWLALIVAVVALVQSTQHVRQRPIDRAQATGEEPGAALNEPSAGAEEVLALRYARGEVDDDYYQRRLAALRSSHPSSSG